MEEIGPLQRQLHVITDDNDNDDDGKEILRQEYDNQCGMYCCCFSTVPMPACCMAAFLDPSPSLYDGSTGVDSSDAHTEITVFKEAARIARTIGAAVIKREAAAINRRLLQIQNQGLQLDEESVEEVPSQKRRKLSVSDNREESPYADRTQSENHGDNARAAAAVSQQDQASIWNQVHRMKRMSIFLKNAQLAQNLLLQEMRETLGDSTYLGAAAAMDP